MSIRMMKAVAAFLFWGAGLTAAPLQAETTHYTFDTPEEVQGLKSAAIWVGNQSVAGGGSAAFLPNPTSSVDYVGCSFRFATNSPEGVLTFWVYDPIFELAKNLTWLEIGIGCTRQNEDGKATGKSYSIMDFRGAAYGGWMFGTGLLTDLRETRAIRHAGWTRFDIVNPPGAEPQPFLVCVDGHEVFQTRDKLLSLQSLTISARSVMTPIYFDEVSCSTNVSSYRPNVIQSIQPRTVTLQARATLPVGLRLAAKGAREGEGVITVKVYDGAEREISRASAPVVWAKVGAKPLTVALPGPPRSGSFWVEATYQEKGMARPDMTRARVDVQYLTPGFEHAQHARLPIETDWDFVPSATNEVPVAPPQDWTNADSLSGPWFSRVGGVKNVSLCDAAWYRQVLEVPADWKGRRICLDIDDPQTVVHAFVDGKKVGEIASPGGTLDLTQGVRAGKTFDLALFVVATSIFGKNKVARELLGDKYQMPTWQGTLSERGLSGEVVLRSEPAGARIDGVAIRTTVEAKRLWTQFDCAGLTPGQTYKVVSAASAAGALDKQLPAVSFVAKSGSESVTAEADWANPVLWDVGAPFLYALNARLETADGKVLDTIRPERFGFREILTKGHLMTLNGKPLSLFDPRGVSAAMTRNFGLCDWMRRMGYNSAYRTDGYSSRLDAKYFDEAGIPRRMDASDGFGESNIRVLAQYGKEQDPVFWDVYRKQIEYYIKRYRNCPSVFLWRGPYYTSETGLEMNPLLQDGIWLRAPESDLEKRTIDMGHRCYAMIHALDPTRYQDDLTTLNYNDTINFHCYVGFSPIQEFIERNEHWIKYGTKPVFIDEYASPFITDWCNSPWEGGGGHTSPRKVPQVAEWCAVTKGDQAFVRDAVEDAALKAFEKAASNDLASVEKIADPQKRAVAQGIRSIGSAFGAYSHAAARNPDNLRDQVWEERLKENLFNWRADGVAGMCSFLGEGGNEWKLLPKYYAPVVAYLAGTPEKRTAKDHIFAPGETLRRSVLALNNGRQESTVHCAWKLVLGGQVVADGVKRFIIPGGGQFTLPIETVIPPGGDCQGELSMTLSADGKELCSDKCTIDVLFPRPFKNLKTLALIDPEGDSARSLEKAGVTFQLLPFNADFSAYETVIFGRRAFDYELQCLPEGLDLGALTRLGKNILVMEQAEKTLRERFKFRTEYASPRDVYARVGGSPLFDGLPDSCLKFWRGAATLTSGYEVALQNLQPPKGYRAGAWYPYVGNDGKEKKRYIKWGNTHTVATVVIVKPDTGNFRTLVDCEFALNYAAALELRHARGNVVFSQLDVSGRTQADPAAERYLANLVSYVRQLQTPVWRQAAYLGDDEGAGLLESLRVDVKRIGAPADAKPTDVLVLGGADVKVLVGWKDALAAFVQAGGMVFCLPKTGADFDAGFLPFAVETRVKAVNQSAIGKATDPLLLGLGNADFYWKGDIRVTALDKVAGAALLLDSGVLARVPHGRGEYVLCQIQPGLFDVDTRFWLDRSRRFNERALVALLSNGGVEMAAPHLLRAPKAKADLAGTLDLAGVWEIVPGLGSQEACPGDGPAWRKLAVPGGFQGKFPDLAAASGTVWYRRTFEAGILPEGATVELLIGQVSGCDRTFVNGVKVGQSDMNSHVNDVAVAIRKYALPAGLLKHGANQIAIRVDFDRDNLLGLRNSDGSIRPPVSLNIFKPVGGLADAAAPFSLEGQWSGCAVGTTEAPCPPRTDPRWHPVTVPGNFESQHPDWDKYNGFFWYRKSFTLPSVPAAGAEPFLVMGGVDDWDTTWLNGAKIGHTGVDNFFTLASAYNTPRKYPIPSGLLRAGENEITLLVDDPRFDGGIALGPVELIFSDPVKVAKRHLLASNYLNLVTAEDDPFVARHW
jgi:beta-galactosidase